MMGQVSQTMKLKPGRCCRGRRPRNSQFDRGKPAQLREDAYYNQMPQMTRMSPPKWMIGWKISSSDQLLS